MPRQRSPLWEYFTRIDIVTAKCELCGKIIRNKGNTTNMWNHLKRRHINEYGALEDYDANKSLKQSMETDDSATEVAAKFWMCEACSQLVNISSFDDHTCVNGVTKISVRSNLFDTSNEEIAENNHDETVTPLVDKKPNISRFKKAKIEKANNSEERTTQRLLNLLEKPAEQPKQTIFPAMSMASSLLEKLPTKVRRKAERDFLNTLYELIDEHCTEDNAEDNVNM